MKMLSYVSFFTGIDRNDTSAVGGGFGKGSNSEIFRNTSSWGWQ